MTFCEIQEHVSNPEDVLAKTSNWLANFNTEDIQYKLANLPATSGDLWGKNLTFYIACKFLYWLNK